jgi:hypothetical protein
LGLTAAIVVWVLLDHLIAGLASGVIASAIGLLVALLSWLNARPPACWELLWDGRAWALRSPNSLSRSGEPDTLIDTADWLLLRWRPERADGDRGSPRWLPVSRSSAGPAWHAFRVAVKWAARGEGPAPVTPKASP